MVSVCLSVCLSALGCLPVCLGLSACCPLACLLVCLLSVCLSVCLHIPPGRPKEYFGTPQCFELFGMDVMFDEDLRCWLLEFNALPGLDTLSDDQREVADLLSHLSVCLCCHSSRLNLILRHLYLATHLTFIR